MKAPDMDERVIFDRALDLTDPVERAAYLEEACGQDAGLRARVESLLRSHERAGSFLQGAAIGSAATLGLPITEKPGTVIGPYKLLQQIGEGGMGVVYMAEQTEPVERRVALKIIKPGMDTRQVIARFEAERHALALMDHPNIARVVDAGTTETGRPHFVMELVKGVPITQYCDEHHLTPRERLELFVPVCHAVQHAHQKGIIHRDLKPTNVLVAEYDDRPVPKIIDFGVAKAIQQRLTEQTVFTQLGQVVGTIDYMSPEQAKLNELDVDTRSDIYSLGVLLYELLTGETPLDPHRLRSAAFDEMLRIIREEEPPKPSLRLSSSESLPSIAANRQIEPKKLSTLVRGELDWIVMKALEKDRARRYETANAFAADIEHYLNDEAVQACPPSAAYRFRKFARRNKGFLAATAIIGLILLAASLVSTWQAVRATRAFRAEMQAREEAEQAQGLAQQRADEATAARAEAERAAAEAQAVADFVVNDLLGSAKPEETLGREVTVKEVLANAEKRIDTAFKEQPLREAAVRRTMAEVYRALGQYEAAERHARRAAELHTKLLGAEHPSTLGSMNSVASALFDQRKYDEARKLCEETAGIRKRVLGPEHPHTGNSMSALALTLGALHKLHEARKLEEEALAIHKRVLGPEHPQTLNSMHHLALMLHDLGKLEEARKLNEEILVIQKRVLGPEHPRTLGSMHTLALTLRKLRKLEDARKVNEETLAIRQRVLGPEHPEALTSMVGLAETFRELGKLDEARKLYEETLGIQKRVLGPEAPDTLGSMHNLALTLMDLGKLEEARKLAEETLAIQKRVSGAEHPKTLTMMNLALVLHRLGKSDEARKLYEETLATQKRVLGLDHPDTLLTMNNLAIALKKLPKLQEAHRLWQESLRDLHKVAMDKPQVQPLQNRVAKCEREICHHYGAMGLWELAATAARHNAALKRVTERERDLAPCRIDTDHAIFLAATGEQQAWREYCQLVARRLTEESPPEPTTWWLIRTSCLVEPPALDAELCSTQGSKRLGSGKKRSKFGEACVALAQYRASRYDEAWKTFTENPLDTPWEAESWSPFNLWAGYAYALAAHGNGLSKDALAQLERADGVYVSICRATLEAGRKELVAGFAGNPWDLAAAGLLRREAWQKIRGQSPPPDPWWHLVQARGYGLIGESQRADKEFAAAVGAASNDPGVWMTRASVFELLGDSARAEADRKKAQELGAGKEAGGGRGKAESGKRRAGRRKRRRDSRRGNSPASVACSAFRFPLSALRQSGRGGPRRQPCSSPAWHRAGRLAPRARRTVSGFQFTRGADPREGEVR
jgi:serine/threonine protein kinase/Tfp pilus assembly protein PilF